MDEAGHQIHDNGAAAPTGEAARGDNATASALAKALEHEKRRNASLMSLLKKTRNKADSFNWVEEPSIEEDLPRQVDRNSTMKESFSGNESSIMTSMALASLNISECKPRDGKEIDKQTFERWKQTLQAALQISGIEDERAKANAFTIKAGEKLKDLLEATSSGVDAPDETLFPYSNMMYRLEQHFGSQDYLLLQRQKLRSLLQETGEEDSKYVRRVVAGAKLCGYSDDSLFENVVDVLQAHALSLDVRKACRKLLRSKEAPKRKLEHLLEEVDALEVDQKHEAIFARNHPPLKVSAEVSAVRSGHPVFSGNHHYSSRGGVSARPPYSPRSSHGYQGQSYSPRPSFGYQGQAYSPRSSYGHHGGHYDQRGHHGSWARGRGKFNSRGKPFQPNNERAQRCWRCTGTYHSPDLCDNRDKICHKCHEKGHIARACDEVPEEHRSKRQLTPEGKFPQPSKLRKVAALADDNDNQPGLESIRQTDRVEDSSRETASSIQSVGVGPSENRGCGTITGHVAGVALVFNRLRR
ncbi:uncharacterized protein LOC119769234 [Culex quinquefasciatus]|uniref:uncharacterized protein LOC119769234 n=1 Tax=Culex quinquefasciatus TaxID=7176 RepID=UPI0018E3D9B4|nr:uncharacterized protein LOC119769234 [Culex quinquefasciatus]